ncbi:sll0787 family AIR synthase-like protein [Salinisphaera sp. SPP-AMP-43]|uniref:sll0787 family AIR synthase-like protein n=1 Tax=Salinisphaera sp. SPP-AMP-43 TaxID=3121288 RepID=UPI003C6E3498
MNRLDAVAHAARSADGIAGKTEIAAVMDTLRAHGADPGAIRIGDDCAAIADGDGWLLFAIEGFVKRFVACMPWFAGYCGVMVNISDIAAMGGRASAVVDAVWSRDMAHARPIVEGMAAAARAYGVPIVGGHSNAHSDDEQLSVAIIGRARQLLTSFDARPGDILVAAIDLRGRYREPLPNWDASTEAPAPRLRADLELLPELAEAGLCRAAKDISMGGLVGTAMMLAESSRVGAVIDIARVPRPDVAEPARWLCETFPSFGFLLAVAAEDVAAVTARFSARGIACAAIGHCDDSLRLRLREAGAEREIRDFRTHPYIACASRQAVADSESSHA